MNLCIILVLGIKRNSIFTVSNMFYRDQPKQLKPVDVFILIETIFQKYFVQNVLFFMCVYYFEPFILKYTHFENGMC